MREEKTEFLLVWLALRFRWLGGTVWQRRHWEKVRNVLCGPLGSQGRKVSDTANLLSFQHDCLYYLSPDLSFHLFPPYNKTQRMKNFGFPLAMFQHVVNFAEGRMWGRGGIKSQDFLGGKAKPEMHENKSPE